ncbi:uncharacterized protein LOC107010231 isoform X14 [Solanum pennellii]|uniref:Uncharacterized protein LOC107010231 isoform X14 n=1 Tax=Solanum pennellii TaxID=28526 RepID=A0ABM1V3E4_SOLPN|nr:uncharacterized protein LOC107010231 isoform X14 [Solanum pennellii]
MRMSSYISALVLWFQGFITQMIKCFKLIVSPTLIARGIDLDQTICNFLLMLQSVLNNHYDGSMNFMHRDELTTSLQGMIKFSHAEMHPIPSTVCRCKLEKLSIRMRTISIKQGKCTANSHLTDSFNAEQDKE